MASVEDGVIMATDGPTIGQLLGDAAIMRGLELLFVRAAIAYDRGDPPIMSDAQWDALGYALQSAPGAWSDWFRNITGWIPGQITKPTTAGMALHDHR